MKAVTLNATNAKNIKKFMKLSGINVTRCKQNTQYGILLTIENTVDNINRTVNFLAEFNLTRKNGSKVTSEERINIITKETFDFGCVFHTNTLNF